MNIQHFNRYLELAPDPAVFIDSCSTPLPLTGWIHPNRPVGENWISSIRATEMRWNPNGFRLSHSNHLPFLWAFLQGSCLIQEEAAMAALSVLPIQPGDNVLDMCAAPGNKTAQLSVRLGNTGTVVANEINASRLGVLNGTVDRLGLANVLTTNYDARNFPIPGALFDHVLADVPCTCEGTIRKHPRVAKVDASAERKRLCGVQESILERALACVKPGGSVLYATCTFAPEENERVVYRVLQRGASNRASADLEPINIPGFNTRPGLTSWNGEHFGNEMSRCIRIWPEDNDTGGFFLALIRKNGTLESNTGNAEINRNHVLQHEMGLEPCKPNLPTFEAFNLESRFLSQFAQITNGRKYARFISRSVLLDDQLSYLSLGMTGANIKSGSPRLSTALSLKIGPHCQAGTVELVKEELPTYYTRSAFERSFPFTRYSNPLSVALCEGRALGLVHHEAITSSVASLFPKVWGGVQVGDRIATCG